MEETKMIYAPHTFELTLYLGYKKYDEYLKKAFNSAVKKHRAYRDDNDENVTHDEVLKSHGIRIKYVWSNYKKRIILVVNPSKLLGGDDIPKLWKPTENNIAKMLDKLEKHIDSYFNTEVELNDFTLTRMDFTVNIDLKKRKNVSDYIKVLHNLGKVKGYTPMKDAGWINKELAFVLRGNSNDITFWAYDKEGREEMLEMPKSRLKAARGILRIEIQVTTNKTLLNFTDKCGTKKQIKNLAKRSEDIFMHNFTRIMPRGDFCKKSKAEELVREEPALAGAEQRKMLKLIELIPKKKSLLLAQKELKSKDIKSIMRCFENLDLCPVTISKRHGIKHLRSLYYYIK
jgi:hypothetical protein